MILQFFAKTLQQLDLTGVLALSSLGLKAAGKPTPYEQQST